jgi:hypothetical protein
VGHWRCGLRYRASKACNARACYWHILTVSIFSKRPLVLNLIIHIHKIMGRSGFRMFCAFAAPYGMPFGYKKSDSDIGYFEIRRPNIWIFCDFAANERICRQDIRTFRDFATHTCTWYWYCTRALDPYTRVRSRYHFTIR